MARVRKLKWKLAAPVLTAALTVLGINLYVVRSTDSRLHKELDSLPYNDVGLVLGVSRSLGGGGVNPHFKNRMEAAALLYREAKIRHVIASGDNHVAGYDEPTDMKRALMELGVPESAITLDYAGFRTLDSVARAKAIFNQPKITVITDEFHANRAVFLCDHFGIDSVAYCSAPVPFSVSGAVRFREVAARVKAALDVYILNKKPKFYGEKVEIDLGNTAHQ